MLSKKFTQFMYRIENQIKFSCAILLANIEHKLHNKLFYCTPINTPLKQQWILMESVEYHNIAFQ